MIMPQPKTERSKGLFDISDYQKQFHAFADLDVLKCLFCLFKRENKPFTANPIEKELRINAEKAYDILNILTQYSFVKFSEVEIDDVIQKVYSLKPNPAFIAILAISKELIESLTLLLTIQKTEIYHI